MFFKNKILIDIKRTLGAQRIHIRMCVKVLRPLYAINVLAKKLKGKTHKLFTMCVSANSEV